MVAEGIKINSAKVLIEGITFKENVPDIRNSKVIDLIRELQDYHIEVDVVDAIADAGETKAMYGITLVREPTEKYDAVVLAVAHDIYKEQTLEQIKKLCKEKLFLFDLKGIFRDNIKNYKYENFYWSL